MFPLLFVGLLLLLCPRDFTSSVISAEASELFEKSGWERRPRSASALLSLDGCRQTLEYEEEHEEYEDEDQKLRRRRRTTFLPSS